MATPIFSTMVEAAPLLVEVGSRALDDAELPAIAAGESLLTTAILEDLGEYTFSDINLVLTRAGDETVLNGRKLFVRDAATANGIIVFGRTTAGGCSAVLVPLPATGVAIERMPASGGEPLYAVTFRDVRAANRNVLSENAWPLAENVLRRGAALKSAELAGIGQSALDLSVEYTTQRVQFGRPIGSFQAVQHHAADIYRNVVASRMLAYQAAEALANRPPADWEVSLAKSKSGDAILSATRLAHQVHGGVGYYTNYPLELFTRRAMAANAAYGNSAFHRRRAAGLMRSRHS